ncbi:MAG: hypothetical protein E2O56_07490 [Gammaproteobacteria bacterium]|nr:MAG: hypothetical protein E2O56_07490 [Gammaproteobacteria bacterium]
MSKVAGTPARTLTKTAASLFLAALVALLSGCGGGGGGRSTVGTAPPPPGQQQGGCTGSCADATIFLTLDDVGRILAQAIDEATARSQPATIAIVDRVGNVLAVFKMNGAPDTVNITGQRGVVTGLDGINDLVSSEMSAIAKAITGAFLSTEGNAFTTRTASQIIQQNFNPGELNQPAGPLFGVQFSQLACSDLINRFIPGSGTNPGPMRSPLGLSADPGGIPLYIDGTPVGAIGVESDGFYSLDLVITDFDRDPDEIIAIAGNFGYAAPNDRRADEITADGKVFRFTDTWFGALVSDPATAQPFAALNGVVGNLVPVTGYTDGALLAGTAFSTPASGIRADNGEHYPGLDAFVLVDGTNTNRYPPRDGTDGADALTAAEVRTLMVAALGVANSARAQIRRPPGSQARVTVSVVDTNGAILAVARTRDGPMFGTDVSLQKARTAVFFSGDYAADDLNGAPDTTYPQTGEVIAIGDYVTAVRAFLGMPTALADGAVAFADRSGGNLSRPFFPDGITGTPNGPFSKPFAEWSPFSTGLQLDISNTRILEHILFVLGLSGTDVPQNCTTIGRLPNGIQIFPGSVPIYRDRTLVGGIGVSGDGVDQDDMISFLGLHRAGNITGTFNNAPPDMRADQLTPQGIRLRYVQCPQAPFIDSAEQNVCEGL